jgi:hypothetical protein
VPPEFAAEPIKQGRHEYQLPSQESGSLELITETASESVANRGLFHYLTVMLFKKDAQERIVNQLLLVDSSYLEAAD